jgi:GDP-fucose transporter C1
MLLLNNLCLAYVHVTFYQVARSWTIIMSLLLSYFFYGDNPSRGQLICCLVVIAGYILACDGTVAWGELFTELKSLSLTTLTTAGSSTKIILGIVSGFFSCFMVAYHSIISKQLQQTTTISRSTLISALNINASILLFIYIFITGEFQATISNPALYDSKTALPLLIVSFSGYLLGYATQMQIQYTSPLGHNVSGTAKATVQSALGWFLQPLKITPLAVFGTAVTIIGCGVYSVVGGPAKTQQGPPPAPPKKADVNAPPRWAQPVFPLKSH